ncbi:DMT family transporter [Variovorax sp. E3]|uniref:DMT family transporter n=1 Tax=Variovorax sp. E3 TaxID=1914993 RepID=UPI0018DCDFE8|nr:DMT family transporter [Variovorax sp. E3]
MDRNLRIGLLAALAAAFIGSAWQLVSRHGVTTTLGPMELALLRYGIPALLLAPLWFGQRLVVPPEAPRIALVLLVVGGGLPFGLLVLAGARWAPASHMGLFMAGSLPLFTAIGAWIHKGQKVEGVRLAGLACIALGMALFAAGSFRSGSLDWRGDLLFLAAAMLWAVHSLAFSHCGLTPWQGAAFVNGWSSLLLLPVLAIAGAPRLLSAPWPDVALQALAQGLVAGVLGLVIYMLAVARLGAARASLSAAAVPVLTTLGAAAWMNEPVTGAVLLALALVVPGIVLASGAVRWRAREARTRPRT